jgi:hypothetical protein
VNLLHSWGLMRNATSTSGDIPADRFYYVYASDGRAVLMSSPRDDVVDGAQALGDNPELWLVRFGARLVAVDDYDPQMALGYVREYQHGDSVWSIVADWLAHRAHQRALRKAQRKALRSVQSLLRPRITG